MVNVTIHNNALDLEMEGFDKLWTLRSHLEIPLANVRDIHQDTDQTRRWWKGLRAPGTRLPGVIQAGTFYQDGQRIFYDVHNPDNAVIIDLEDDRYNELVVEVNNPQTVINQVQKALELRTIV
jgi:hypothetical protein